MLVNTVEIDEGVIETEVAVENYAGLEDLTVNMLVMFYDEDGRLISCEMSDDIELVEGINYGAFDVTPVEGAVTAKFATWSGDLGAYPITTAETISLQ